MKSITVVTIEVFIGKAVGRVGIYIYIFIDIRKTGSGKSRRDKRFYVFAE